MSNELIALAIPPGKLFVEELQRAWDNDNAVLPIDLRLPDAAIQRVLRAMAPSKLIDRNGDMTHLYGNDMPVEPGDALVMSTSGTTGEPKGVVLTHDAIRASSQMTSTRLGVTNEDHWLCCLPVAHIGGLSVVTRALHTNTPLTVLSHFDPAAVDASDATLVSLVTTALQRIDASRFRAIVLGAGHVPEALPAHVFPTYGMTETASGIYYRDAPLDGVELRIVDGEIHIKSPTLLRCYRDGTDPKTADGWLPSGDAGYFDDLGRLHVQGRIDDMINTGGEKVWPAHVESLLRQHPAVTEALVFGEADPQWGERVVAKVETNTTVGSDALREFLEQYLPTYAVPKQFIVVDALDRTLLGKLIRQPRPHS